MEGKSDGGKEQNPRASSSATMEMPALFPRLHVNATERAGPRAPPRNKMALYEQFTIPSQQRLVSPSIVIARFGQPTVHNPYGHQFYNDYQYPYCSHDMPPTFAYRRTGGASYFPSQPSLPLASSALICTIDFDGGQYLPRNHPGVRAGLARSTMAAPVSGSHQSPRGKKAKLDSHKLHASSTEKEFQENASVPGLSRTEVLDVEIQGCVNVKKKGHQRDIELQGISKSENQHQTFSKGDRFLENIAAPKKISSKQSGAKNGGEPREQNTSNQCNAFDEETFDAGTIGDCLAAESLPANAHQKVSKATKSLIKSIESSADEATSFSLPDQVADVQQELPNSEMENSLKSDKYSFKLRQQSNTNEKGYESYNTFENPSNGGDKILEMAHLDTTKYNQSGPLVQASAQKIAPKHIVQAIGQQFFWQARISILRQQQIFADQVFELHKLIQMQHMLASPLIEVDVSHSSSSTMLKCDAATLMCKSQRSGVQTADLKPKKARNPPIEDHGGCSIEQEIQPKLSYCSGKSNHHDRSRLPSHTPYKHMHMDLYPSLPAVAPAGACAWGFPHPGLGAGQWIGPSPTWSDSFLYQSFGGHSPVSAAFLGGYSHAVRPALSPSTSYSLPGCSRQAECSHDIYAIKKPTVSGPQWKSMYNSQDIPVSIASSYVKQALPPEPAKTVDISQNQKELLPVSEAFKVKEYENCREKSKIPNSILQSERLESFGTQSGSNGFTRHAIQAKKTVTNGDTPINVGKSVCMPSNVDEQAERSQDARKLRLECRDFSGSHSGAPVIDDERCSFRHEETPGRTYEKTPDQWKANAVDQSQNALSLFPLAPVLNSKEQSKVQQNRVIRVVPRSAFAASESAAGILLSIQQERRQ